MSKRMTTVVAIFVLAATIATAADALRNCRWIWVDGKAHWVCDNG